uniref:Uncharacterized protein n=1 Tax=Physcomitrium patens TaxID=3218 RepID=A0A2K1JN52_PHYPA|nr:hypothetical protein PHYPA_017802 [Physcomitrium patens]
MEGETHSQTDTQTDREVQDLIHLRQKRVRDGLTPERAQRGQPSPALGEERRVCSPPRLWDLRWDSTPLSLGLHTRVCPSGFAPVPLPSRLEYS